MKFVIKHEIKGRIRAHAVQYRMTFEQADGCNIIWNPRI